MRAPAPYSPAESVTRYFFFAAALAFACSSVVGLLAALTIAWPQPLLAPIGFPVLRPLHTFFAIAAVLTGLQGLVLSIIGRCANGWPARLQLGVMAAFIVAGAVALALAMGSGREYFSWPLPLTALLLLAFLLMLWRLFSAAAEMQWRSPEGFWLIGLGGLLIFASLIESELWRFNAVAADYVRNLTLQWHGIDSFFAGLNIALYGCAAYLVSDQPKPLRRPMLFTIAGFGLLFTFGHHHYVSPQPNFLKSLAVVASMIAVLSFWRHVVAYRAMQAAEFRDRHLLALWRSVALWTLVSIATGVLFAVPQINLIVHGTYIIVAHSMGSMIGVNLMIIVAGGFARAHRTEAISVSQVMLGVRLVNLALVWIWIDLGAAGLVKGVMRVGGGYHDYQPILDLLLYGFPLGGIALISGIGLLCAELVRANLKAPSLRSAACEAAKMT